MSLCEYRTGKDYDDITVEVMTTSEDGYVKWWDLRSLQQPTLEWRLQEINKQEGKVLSGQT